VKVLIIGAGAQGNVISWVLSRGRDVREIVLGDINLDRAKEIAEMNGSGKVKAERLNANDVDSMTELMKERNFNLVINATLPDFNSQIMQACYSAKINYQDMATGTTENFTIEEGTSKELSVNKEWRDAGLQALMTTGSTPGVTNVLIKEVYERMTEVDDIEIRCVGGYSKMEIPMSLWSAYTFILDCSTPPLVYENGAYKRYPPFSGREEIETKYGKEVIVLHDHEELTTVPKFLKIKNLFFKMGDLDTDNMKALYDLGLMGSEKIEVNGVKVEPRKVLAKLFPPTPLSLREYMKYVEQGKLDEGGGSISVKVRGNKDGTPREEEWIIANPTLVECAQRIPGSSDVSYGTSVSAAICSLMMLRGQVKHKGVFPPEVFDEEEREIFLKGIGEWDIKISERK